MDTLKGGLSSDRVEAAIKRVSAREEKAATLWAAKHGLAVRTFVLRVDWRLLLGGEIGAASPFPLLHAECGAPYIPERVVRHLARAGLAWLPSDAATIDAATTPSEVDRLLGAPPRRGAVRFYSAFPVGRVSLTYHSKTPHAPLGKRDALYPDRLPNPTPVSWLVVAAPTAFNVRLVGTEKDLQQTEQLIRAGAEVEGCGKCTALAMGRLVAGA